jgi:hypothetical protein
VIRLVAPSEARGGGVRSQPGVPATLHTEAEEAAHSSGPRILFLDDDPARAATFLAAAPRAVWVETAEKCIARLAESWDEVHLDHDLGGEKFVDFDREDTGMGVVRWLCGTPRPHLGGTRFIIHTRNINAACMMVIHLEMGGFDVTARPFDDRRPEMTLEGTAGRLLAMARGLVRRVAGI